MRIEDSHHSSARAMALEITLTGSAFSAPEVDLANDSFTNDLARPCLYGADKLVARYACETHVAAKNLQIGGADTGKVNFDQSG
jgi:hypothetical protein